MRFCHFVAAFVFFFNFLFRIYWGFVGNRYARWDNFILLRRAKWREVLAVLKVDVFQVLRKPLDSIGHNALAGLTYFLMFLAFLFQAVTGFGLYAAMSTSWFPRLFAWIVPLMGGDFAVRQWRPMMMWFFIIFAMVMCIWSATTITSRAAGSPLRWSAAGSSSSSGRPPPTERLGTRAKGSSMESAPRLLILGIGNLLMGDRGSPACRSRLESGAFSSRGGSSRRGDGRI